MKNNFPRNWPNNQLMRDFFDFMEDERHADHVGMITLGVPVKMPKRGKLNSFTIQPGSTFRILTVQRMGAVYYAVVKTSFGPIWIGYNGMHQFDFVPVAQADGIERIYLSERDAQRMAVGA